VADRRITTFTGKLVDVFDLRPEDVCIEDIAHALSQINRYGGHTAFPYSVGQHSTIMARELEYRRASNDICRQALLHDAAEAYISDLPQPIKREIPRFTEIEGVAWDAICKALDIEQVVHPLVYTLDKEMVYHEAKFLFLKRDPIWENELNAMATTFTPHIQWQASGTTERNFLALWNRYNDV